MKRLERWTAGIGIGSATLFAPAVLAGATGSVGIFSEYMFRGIVAEGGVAVQGNIEYIHDSGFLFGVWGTNTSGFGGSEFDVYVGYTHSFSDTLAFDIGALYYLLPEDKEEGVFDFDGDGELDRKDLDTLEFFTSLYWGPVKAQVYFSDDYTATDEEAFYYTLTYTHQFNDTVSLAAQVGYTHGDGAELFYGDKYWDYSLTLTKTIRDGLVFSFGFVDTNLKDEGYFEGTRDDPKVVVGIKQTFDF